jgi:hypothetical protein
LSGTELPDLFARALDLPPAERESLLAEIAGADAGLAADLSRLLAAEGGACVLDRSPWPARGEDVVPALPDPVRIGPYRILRELGRGGMGRVFLAEQEGAGFTRRVALKVVALGGAGVEVERRFREERRILAALEHPGIARFYDAGRAEDGTWFLALEYVKGTDFLSFVERSALDVRARVELFLQVLDAVDFAHRRLIVHRDLKPGNVLVGGDGRAKLLDFGISKILDADEETNPATRTELRALTPAYASPEQLRGERVTIAADVYSLGVMLYEVLAGRRPAASGDPPAAPPAPPSGVLRARGGEASNWDVAPLRWREVQGDLDAIAHKALRSEPEGRYRSAAAFADDLRRWLSGQPVEARRGSRRYRVSKFVARHRLALGAAAAVVLALAGGFSEAMVQRSRALAAQAKAEATIADLHRLSQSMLFEIYDQVRVLPGSLAVSSTIVRRATEVLDRLAATAGDDPRMLRDLAAGYEQLGVMLGPHPSMMRSLNRPRAAVDVLTRATEIRGRLAAMPDARFADRLAAADSLGALARAQTRARDSSAAEVSTQAAIERLERLHADPATRAYVGYRLAVAHTRASRDAGTMSEEHPENDPHFAAADRYWREFVSAPPAAALAEEQFTHEVAAGNLVLLRVGHYEEGLRLSELGLEALARHPPPRLSAAALGGRRAMLLVTRFAALDWLARKAEAFADLKEAVSLYEKSPLDPDNFLNEAIQRMGNYQRAAEWAAAAGELDFATRALAEGERLVAAAEQRYGAAMFAGARIELERSRGDVLALRAESAAPPERRRILAEALATYRAALVQAESLGGAAAMHGTPPDRLEDLRRLVHKLEARLR